MHPDKFPHSLFTMENYNSLHHLGAHGQKNDAFEKLRFHANPSHTILKCGSPFSFTILGAVLAKNFSTPDEAKRRFRETSRSNSHLDFRCRVESYV